ncbi:MG2 domain-containing protein, partial [Fulvivirga sp.]
EEGDLDENWDAPASYENSEWDYYEDYYEDEYYYDYDWQERDNPCHPTYYRQNRKVSRNILASNIGLIAKAGKDKKMLIAATDIRTTATLASIDIEIFNYQNQLIGTSKTDQQGMITIDLESKPYLLVAKNGAERGYLKLDDGSSLSLSQFDVSGQVVQNGLKGFIYGERGVWRPGDTLFLNLMLEDKAKVLPESHPVIFELTNPLGQITHRKIQNIGLNGFYNFTVSTDPEAPTGNWTAKMKVGGATFTKIIKIEAIKPNRLKVKLDFGVDRIAVNRPDVKGDMTVSWLHGAPARNLRAKVGVTLTQAATKFDKFPDYHFTDPARNFSAEEQVIFDSNIDQNGNAQVTSNIKVHDTAPGMLKANFVTRVFEESGDFSIDRYSIPYSPFERYIGIKTPEGDRRGMLLTDTLHTVNLVSVDPDGKQVSVDDLDVVVYKLNWRWWWDSSDEYLANYVGSSYKGWVQKFKAKTVNGKGSFNFKIEYPDWGRYMVRVTDKESGHSTGKIVYIDWPGWAGRGTRENPGGASMLSFSSDKGEYKVGEAAKISIPASDKGRALLTVESGSKVLQATWIEVDGKEVNHSLTITPDMAPNAFVSVTMLQPHVHDNNLPIRLYGVIPIAVSDPQTHLEPVIVMPDELAPETKVDVKISEKNGKKMTYTVAVVDDGLLDLTRFSTPNPHPVFYAREALGVKTWDLYDYVLGAYGGKLERLLSVGGDEDLGGGAKEKVNRFKPMVRFYGPYELKGGGTNNHEIDIPNYIGSVRTMVIAGQDGAYGNAEKTTPVKKPLMVLATLPRVLGPDEVVKLPVTVFAMDTKVKDVTIKVEANDKFKKGFESIKKIHFNEVGDQVVNFELEVAQAIGKGELNVTVTSGREKASYPIELEVRIPNTVSSKFVEAVIEEGQSADLNYELFGITGTNSASLELSNIPPVDFERRLKYLIEYPHGCIEQTTSQAFPQLYIADVMEIDIKVQARMSDNVKSALRKLNSFQFSDGGFSYWPNGTASSDWATSYAGHFMLEAEAKGFTLPIGLKNKWIQYQQRTARNYSPVTTTDSRGNHVNYRYDFAQAYRLYTLALAGKPEIGAMNRLKADNKMGLTGIWRLALSYHLAGQSNIANQLIGNLSTYVPTKGNDSYTYGSVDRDNAMMLEAMSVMNRKTEAISLAKQISSALSGKQWMSTQSTAYCLLAMVKYAGTSGTSKEMKFKYDINGKKEDMISNLPLKLVQVDVSKGKSGTAKVTNRGEGVLFARMVVSGIAPQGEEISESKNLSISVKYQNMDGGNIDPTKIEQGTDFAALVTVSHNNPNIYLQDMAITQIFPSGWEILNTRMDGNEALNRVDVPQYQDIRDDRVLTYFNLSRYSTYNSGGFTKTFKILLNAAYLGKFYLPAVSAECMYDNEIFAREAGKWVEVVRPGE